MRIDPVIIKQIEMLLSQKNEKKIQIEGGRLGSIVFQVVKILFPKNEYS